jgi:hypothetical protein
LENPIDNLITDAIHWKYKPDIALSNGFRFCPPLVVDQKKGIAEIETMLAALGTKASNGFDINFYMKVFGAGQGQTTTPVGTSVPPIPTPTIADVVPMPVAAPVSNGNFDYLGVGAAGGTAINLTINNAGSVIAEQDLQNAILEGIQRVQYYGANPILTNGGR